jgi:hypothetical protein
MELLLHLFWNPSVVLEHTEMHGISGASKFVEFTWHDQEYTTNKIGKWTKFHWSNRPEVYS